MLDSLRCFCFLYGAIGQSNGFEGAGHILFWVDRAIRIQINNPFSEAYPLISGRSYTQDNIIVLEFNSI